MDDKMTSEHRARLKAWQDGEAWVEGKDSVVESVAEAATRLGTPVLLQHLKEELRRFVDTEPNMLQAQGLLYYAQAIADLEYFIETGKALRTETVNERAKRCHDVMLRASIPLEQ